MKAIWSSLIVAVACATTAFAGDSLPGTFDIFSSNPADGTTTALNLVLIYTPYMDSFHVLSTNPQTVDWQGLTLSGGVIETIPPPPGYYGPVLSIGAAKVQESYPQAGPGPFPTWANVPIGLSEPWTAADNGDGTSTLSLSGFSSLFSLCESSFPQGAAVIPAVVFNASSSAVRDGPSTYDGSSCVPITLLAIAQS